MREILKEIFSNYLLSILILALAWIPIFLLKRFLEYAVATIVVKKPIIIEVSKWREKQKIDELVMDIARNKLFNESTARERSKMIAAKIVELNRRFYKLPTKLLVRMLLDKWKIQENIKDIYQDSLGQLEADMAFTETYSTEPEKRFNAYQTIIEHQKLSDELVLQYMIPKLRFLDTDALISILYTLGNRINTEVQISTVKEIVENKIMDLPKYDHLKNAYVSFETVAELNIKEKHLAPSMQ